MCLFVRLEVGAARQQCVVVVVFVDYSLWQHRDGGAACPQDLGFPRWCCSENRSVHFLTGGRYVFVGQCGGPAYLRFSLPSFFVYRDTAPLRACVDICARVRS